MKKKLTTLLAVLLCTILTVAGICADTAYAADYADTLKVTFKKKSVTLNVNREKIGIEPIKIKTLKKKWGKPEVTKDEYSAIYTWKKGKTEITYTDDFTAAFWSGFSITIEDKNASIAGLKVGMSKKKAEKILKTLGEVNSNEDADFVQMTEAGRCNITCQYKKGKVSRIAAYIYRRQD